MLSLTSTPVAQLIIHAQTCYPEECCGLLLGQGKVIQEIWPTENTWTADFPMDLSAIPPSHPESRRNRFAIAPEAILQAQKYARAQGLAIIGIYHSHPDHPAIPSEYDRAIAWEIYSYLILSVEKHQFSTYRSWVLDGDRQFQEEAIQILQSEVECVQ